MPLALLFFGIFASGLVLGLVQSLGYFPALNLNTFTFEYYEAVFKDPQWGRGLLFSLYTAFTSAFLSTCLGLLLAMALLRMGSKTLIEGILYRLPIMVPHTVAAFLVMTLLGQSGILSRVAWYLGLIQEMHQFPILVLDDRGLGVLIAYVWKGIPFVTLVIYGVLNGVEQRFVKVSKNLGASSLKTFRYVVFPMIAPNLLTAFLILFAFSFGAFEVPYLLGPTSNRALPVLAYVNYLNPDLSQRPYAMAMNMIIALFGLILVWLYSKSYELVAKIDMQ